MHHAFRNPSSGILSLPLGFFRFPKFAFRVYKILPIHVTPGTFRSLVLLSVKFGLLPILAFSGSLRHRTENVSTLRPHHPPAALMIRFCLGLILTNAAALPAEGFGLWPVGKLPKEFQRPELDMVREAGYDWKDAWDVVSIFEQKMADLSLIHI